MDPFVGEIRVFAGNFAPRGWASCQGQLLPISQNTALYSLLGTQYGGDGRTTFALPNLQGRVPVNQGQGTGLSNYMMGQVGGEASHTLTTTEMPGHTHSFNADTLNVTTPSPAGALFGQSGGRQGFSYYAPSSSTVTMGGNMVGVGGGNQAHDNQQPFLVLNYIIALIGIFPPRQ